MAELQENRGCRLKTPLGDDILLVGSLRGTEAISKLFRFELDLGSKNAEIDFQEIIGKNITVEIELTKGEPRLVNGVVSRFRQSIKPDASEDETGITAFYWAEVVPWTWFLTRRQDCRIFQNKSVPDIVKAVFGDLGFKDFDFRLNATYDPLVNCVQYQETDFNFVSRLLESAGIFYFFEHEARRHVMVLADSPEQNPQVEGMDEALFTSTATVGDVADRVYAWGVEEVLQPGKYALTDFNFFDPATDLLVNADSSLSQPAGDPYEVFDYPGGFVNQGGEEDAKLSKGESRVKLRMEEGAARAVVATGHTNCRAFLPGYHFDLDGHPRSDFNKAWLLTEVTHELEQGDISGGRSSMETKYENRITCIPHAVPFRPALSTPRPRISGAQTAVVVGPSGEEIYVDKHGRVKVQFCWDRYGKADENSSCWVRVAQNWAGKQWGILFHPRLGQEVVVEFLDGDPDRPLITGRVYNATQPIPFDGPTQSGILTRSTKGGATDNFNQIRFEDLKGSEQIQVHAEKDMERIVENNDAESVGASQTSTVGKSKSVTVGEDHQESIGKTMSLSVGADRAVTVGGNCSESVQGKQETTIAKNYTESVGAARSVSVGKGNTTSIGAADSTTVGASSTLDVSDDRSVKVGKGLTVKVGKNATITIDDNYVLKAKKVAVEAKDELHIKVGKAELIMKKNGDINFKGNKINIKGSGDVVIKGSKIAQN